MKQLLNWLEQGFTVVALLIFTKAVLTLVLSGGANQENVEVNYDSSLIRLSYLTIYIITTALLVRQWKRTIYILIKNPYIWLLLGIVALSILWSYKPSDTLKDTVTLIGCSLFGLYLAVRYRWEEQIKLMGWAFGIVVILSILFAIALPRYGLMGGIHAGTWRGVFLHKNGLGAMMVLSTMTFLFLMSSMKRHHWFLGLFVCLSAIVLLLSKSTASLVNLILFITICGVYRIFRWRSDLAILALITTVLVGAGVSVLVLLNAEEILGLFGKDLTLTGRTDIWIAALKMIDRQLFLGYGYGGFWHGWDGPSAEIWRTTGWNPTHPHNSYIGLALDLGLVGITVFFLGFCLTASRSIQYTIRSRTPDGVWFSGYLTYLMVFGLTESNLVESNSLLWILYVTVTFSVAIAPQQQAKRRQQSLQNQSVATLTPSHLHHLS